MGQTGRSFFERFNEHTPTTLTNIKNSNFPQHIINEGHSYINFNDNLQPMHICNKGRLMDIWEEFEILKAVKLKPECGLNEKVIIKDNPLLNTAIGISDLT